MSVNKIRELESEADRLEDEAEHLRDRASDIEWEARVLKRQAETLREELRRTGDYCEEEDVKRWGKPIATIVQDAGMKVHLRIGDDDWLSNGHIAWRVDEVPEGWRRVNSTAVEKDLAGKLEGVDMTNPVETGEVGKWRWGDFKREDGETARLNLEYVEAAKSRGADVFKTTEGEKWMLVAFKCGEPDVLVMGVRK